jgi:hypothetical protein
MLQSVMSLNIQSSNTKQPHRWCNGYRARLESSRPWVRASVGSNQDYIKLVLVASPLSTLRLLYLAWPTIFLFLAVVSYTVKLFVLCIWVSEWLLFNANSAMFQLLVYHGESWSS